MKEKYERPDLTVLNDSGGEPDPQPMGVVLPPLVLFAGIAAVVVILGGVYQVAGAVELYAAATSVTAITTQNTVVKA